MAAGYIYGRRCGVAAHLSAPAATTITTAGTYYPVAGTFSNNVMEDFSAATVVTPGIKYDGGLSQYFELDWHASASSDHNSCTVSFGVKKNGVLVSSSVMTAYFKTAGELYNLSGTCVVELTAGDEIQLVITTANDGDIVTVQTYNTTICQFFR